MYGFDIQANIISICYYVSWITVTINKSDTLNVQFEVAGIERGLTRQRDQMDAFQSIIYFFSIIDIRLLYIGNCRREYFKGI